MLPFGCCTVGTLTCSSVLINFVKWCFVAPCWWVLCLTHHCETHTRICGEAVCNCCFTHHSIFFRHFLVWLATYQLLWYVQNEFFVVLVKKKKKLNSMDATHSLWVFDQSKVNPLIPWLMSLEDYLAVASVIAHIHGKFYSYWILPKKGSVGCSDE